MKATQRFQLEARDDGVNLHLNGDELRDLLNHDTSVKMICEAVVA